MSEKLKFTGKNQQDFLQELRSRINIYMDSERKTRFANWNMIVKTVFMFLLYLLPYQLMLFGVVTSYTGVIIMWLLMGMGMIGIGLNVMHDACHGSYSSKKWINNALSYSMNMLGATAKMWKLQHNVLHHTYTNIQGHDDDINTPSILRFSPNIDISWIHKYQFIYVWFLYALSTLSWTTTKEFGQVFRYKKIGLIKGKRNIRWIFTQLVTVKALYFTYILVIPLLFFPVPAWLIVTSFLLMHFTAGLILSLIFQTAHIMPDCKYPQPNHESSIENTWAVHELETTSNFAPASRVFSWLIGGLNFQIEHHLFPKICHVHYKSISKIVRETAMDFNLPYHSQKTFLRAVKYHTKMLYMLGRMERVNA